MTDSTRPMTMFRAAMVTAALWCGWGGVLVPVPVAAMEELSSPSRGEQPTAHSDFPNPHSDLIFRATGAASCRDCHRAGRDGGLSAQVEDNDLVKGLKAKAKGIHGPGRFADCLRCHAGGDKGVEKYRK